MSAFSARRGVPRTTHQWLKGLYNYIDSELVYVQPTGATGNAGLALLLGSQAGQVDFGNASGMIGFYGATGALRPTGAQSFSGTTAASGYDVRSNGGSGPNTYSLGDIVAALKANGLITP